MPRVFSAFTEDSKQRCPNPPDASREACCITQATRHTFFKARSDWCVSESFAATEGYGRPRSAAVLSPPPTPSDNKQENCRWALPRRLHKSRTGDTCRTSPNSVTIHRAISDTKEAATLGGNKRVRRETERLSRRMHARVRIKRFGSSSTRTRENTAPEALENCHHRAGPPSVRKKLSPPELASKEKVYEYTFSYSLGCSRSC